MTYIVTENCIKCKFQDCVLACPVDCFYEGENFLVIHPDECIDCGVCEPECPANAIKADTVAGLEYWLGINKKYAEIWPNITEIGVVPVDAEEWNGKPDKAPLLMTGDESPAPATEKPSYPPTEPQAEFQGESYEIDGTRLPIKAIVDGEKVELVPRASVESGGTEIEGLRMNPENGNS